MEQARRPGAPRLLPLPDVTPVPLNEADLEAVAHATALLRGRVPDAAAALARMEALLDEGKHDIRVLCVALHAAALAEPVTGAIAALDALGRWLDERYEVVGPGTDARKARMFGGTIATLIDEVAASIAAADATNATETPGAASGVRLGAACAALETSLKARGLGAAVVRLGALRGVVEARFPPTASIAEVRSPPALDAAAAPGERPAPLPSAPAPRGGTEAALPVSDRFLDFRARLAAFAELARRKEYEKASLVGADVLKEIAAFDPTVYFPALFADFFADLALVSAHVERSPDPDTVPWTALYRLYRVDLERFVNAPSPSRAPPGRRESR